MYIQSAVYKLPNHCKSEIKKFLTLLKTLLHVFNQNKITTMQMIVLYFYFIFMYSKIEQNRSVFTKNDKHTIVRLTLNVE